MRLRFERFCSERAGFGSMGGFRMAIILVGVWYLECEDKGRPD